MPTEEYFAGAQLGMSIWVGRTWSRRGSRWTIFCSRILEKTSHYAAACAREALRTENWNGIRKFRMWSDGPSQFKSGTYIGALRVNRTRNRDSTATIRGTACVLTLEERRLDEAGAEFGCPKEWKGGWDTLLAALNNEWKAAQLEQPFTEVADVVACWKAWAKRQEALNPPPHGHEYRIEEFKPGHKDATPHLRLDPRCLHGVEQSYSWSFRWNDQRAKARGSLRRVRGDRADLIYLDVRNHGWTGFPVAASGLGRALEEPPGPPPELDPNDIKCDTRIWNGWRVSYCAPKDAKRAARKT